MRGWQRMVIISWVWVLTTTSDTSEKTLISAHNWTGQSLTITVVLESDKNQEHSKQWQCDVLVLNVDHWENIIITCSNNDGGIARPKASCLPVFLYWLYSSRGKICPNHSTQLFWTHCVLCCPCNSVWYRCSSSKSFISSKSKHLRGGFVGKFLVIFRTERLPQSSKYHQNKHFLNVIHVCSWPDQGEKKSPISGELA